MLKKTVLGLATGALFLTAGSALAETYQFDKQSNMRLLNSVFSI